MLFSPGFGWVREGGPGGVGREVEKPQVKHGHQKWSTDDVDSQH